MPETRTVKGFSEDGLPFAEGDFESFSLRPLRYISIEYYHTTKSASGQVLFALKGRLQRKVLTQKLCHDMIKCKIV